MPGGQSMLVWQGIGLSEQADMQSCVEETQNSIQ